LIPIPGALSLLKII